MKRFLITVAFRLIFVASVFAQDPSGFTPQQEANVLPPSPNASNLGKYSGLDLNLSTGMINQSIPLYTFNSINLSLPISLSYTSSGVRVNDMGGSVGTGWNLNVGGVITRTVLGKVDERSPRITSPGGSQTAPSGDFLTFMDLLATGVDDGQPDIFSFNFNGNSGRFILDTLGHPFLLNYSNVKIETYSDGSGYLLFKLTAGDGIQYFFGGDDATELSLTYQGGSGCSVFYPDETATSWYLKQIVHPNGDTISFTYRKNVVRYVTSISQAKYGRDWAAGVDISCPSVIASAQPVFADRSCPNTFETDIATLMEINSTSGAKVRFKHISRRDINDSLVSGIEYYQPGKSTPFKSFSLSYQNTIASGCVNEFTTDSSLYYRHFLTSFSENDSNYAAVKRYLLTYKDIDGLAPRLSYAQDDYGFFNGQSNGGLIPNPQDTNWSKALPTATANRDPDTTYSFRGVLTKITYPTAGSDSIVYEANTVYTHEIVYPPQTGKTVEALTDVSTAQATSTGSFSVNYDQSILIGASVSARPGITNQDGDSYAEFILTDETTGIQIFNNYLTLYITPYGQYPVSLTPGHSYLLSVMAGGHGLSADASFQYQPGDTTSIFYNKVIFGGPRVAKVISRADGVSAPMIKRYFYSDIPTPADVGANSPSLGGLVYNADYKQYLKVPTPCSEYAGSDPGGGGINFECITDYYFFYSMYSNPLIGLYTFSSIPISYRSVYESNGENFENGGIRHDFEIVHDQPAAVLNGNRINGVPMDSYAWINGKEVYTKTFKTSGEQFIPVREVYTHYNTDTRKNKITYSYTAEKLGQPRCGLTVTPDLAAPYYNLNLNAIWQSWVYPDSVVTFTYDNNGIISISDTILTQYGNVLHAMPTAVTRTLSNGSREIQHMYYPDDLTLSGPPETARQALLNNHIVSPVLSKTVIRGGSQVYAQNTDYAVFSNGYSLPRTYSMQIKDQAVQKMIEFYKYDRYGKLLEQSKENDVKQAYIWDYTNTYPIAHVTNADSSSIAYTSFESDGTGSWTIGSPGRIITNGITGQKSYSLNSDVSRTGLNSSTTYIVSYWIKNTGTSSFTIPGTLTGYPVKGRTVTINSNAWTYFEHKISGQSSITIQGIGNIDELRLYPAASQMSTYTYTPLVGTTSQCDVNNRISYYEYDGLGRLSVVKDQDGNVIKTIDYHYKGQ